MKKGRLKRRLPQAGKHLDAPATADTGSTQKLKPHFSFEHLRQGYSISDCDRDQKAMLADRLQELSQLTWAQIAASDRHGQGSEIIVRDAIRGDGIPSHITSDVNLLAFRCFGMSPMVGYRKGQVFYVVWLDRNFSLYDH